MTKQEKRYLKQYFCSTKNDIFNCYVRPSEKKLRAQRQCRDKMYSQNGHSFRILSYNTCFFSCAWLTDDGRLHIETPTKNIEIKEAIDYLPF